MLGVKDEIVAQRSSLKRNKIVGPCKFESGRSSKEGRKGIEHKKNDTIELRKQSRTKNVRWITEKEGKKKRDIRLKTGPMQGVSRRGVTVF